jgi:signal transduction histidine kinase
MVGIEDVLDMARIEAGHTDLKMRRFDLAEAIEAAMLVIRPQATRNDVPIDIRPGFRTKSQFGSGPGKADHHRGLRLARRQAGEPRAVAVQELEAAARPAIAIDRYPGSAQRVDVAIDGALGHLELDREIRCSQPPTQLQQDEDRKEAAGTHRFFSVT